MYSHPSLPFTTLCQSPAASPAGGALQVLRTGAHPHPSPPYTQSTSTPYHWVSSPLYTYILLFILEIFVISIIGRLYFNIFNFLWFFSIVYYAVTLFFGSPLSLKLSLHVALLRTPVAPVSSPPHTALACICAVVVLCSFLLHLHASGSSGQRHHRLQHQLCHRCRHNESVHSIITTSAATVNFYHF